MKIETITQRFLENRQNPSVAIRFKRHKTWIDLTWQEYYRRAEAVAMGLAASGIKAGDRVAILANTRWEWAALDMGILGLGAITVPIYQSSRAEEIEYILKDSGARIVFLEDGSQVRKWESIAKKCKTVEVAVCIQPPTEELPSGILGWDDFLNRGLEAFGKQKDFYAGSIQKGKASDTATIAYTSGTTGSPKGVVLDHCAVLSEVSDIMRAFPISSNDSTLSFLPYAHLLGRVELWLHSEVGFTLCFAESIERLSSNLREVKPTVIIGVPRIFEKIFAGITSEIRSNPWRSRIFNWLEGQKNSTLLALPTHLVLDRLLFKKLRAGLGGRLRFTVSGGAPLDARIAEFFNQAGILILEGYGLTETTAAVTVNTPNAFEFGTVGRPLGEAEIKLAEDGEVLVKSKKVMRGYYKVENSEEQPFRDGYFYTGDIGEWTKNGFLKITDRKKDLIKTAGGKYVAPQRLENLLKLEPLISNALIHGDRKKYIVTLITLDEVAVKKQARENQWNYRDYKSLTQLPEVLELVRKGISRVNAQLASYETIKNFAILDHDFTVENGELTPSLKVKRKVCDERYAEIIEELYKN